MTTRKTKTTKTTTTTTTPEVPSLERVLETMAAHVAAIMTDRPLDGGRSTEMKFSCGLGGFTGTDCPFVLVQGVIRAVYDLNGADPWGVWAQVELDGKSCGNRCGGRSALAAAYAPVIAWVAAYHARKAAADLVAATDGPAIAKAG